MSQKNHWRQFVEVRRAELHNDYPCVAPIRRIICPKHRRRVGPVTGICELCWRELYELLASEYRTDPGLPDRGMAVAALRTEVRKPTDDDRPPLRTFPGRQSDAIPGQLSFDLDEVTTIHEEGELMNNTEIEGELLPDVIDSPQSMPLTLFGTSDPKVAIERMAEMAKLLVSVVRERNLVKRIAGNEYLLAPGWAVLAGMTGLSPYTVWARPLDDRSGFTARVEVRRVSDGAIISAAEQLCTRSEPKWAGADDHALLGMAQTRASSRALRGPLMQIVELAGYKGTPAEEMPSDSAASAPATNRRAIASEHRPTREQTARISELLAELSVEDPGSDWRLRARELAGVSADMLTKAIAHGLIRQLEQRLEAAKAA